MKKKELRLTLVNKNSSETQKKSSIVNYDQNLATGPSFSSPYANFCVTMYPTA